MPNALISAICGPCPNPIGTPRSVIVPDFWGGRFFQNYIVSYVLSSQGSRFLRGRVKMFKNTISVYRWHRNGSLFGDIVLYSFFRKFMKRWLELDFCGVKNATKNDENFAF